MSVLIEGISVVIKAESILDKYPGGWDSFKDDVPNLTLCADSELVRVGFMSPALVQNYIETLEEFGLVHVKDSKSVDIVVADQQEGFTTVCDWAEFYFTRLDGDPKKVVAICSLKNSEVDEILFPDGWEYSLSLSYEYHFLSCFS